MPDGTVKQAPPANQQVAPTPEPKVVKTDYMAQRKKNAQMVAETA